MSSKSKKRKSAPKGDKYPEGSAIAQAERASLNRRWESRQRELGKQQHGATLLHESLQTTDEVLPAWELELIAESHTSSDSRSAPPIPQEEWDLPMVYTSEGARPESAPVADDSSPEERLLRSIFTPTLIDHHLIHSVFGDDLTGHASHDAGREVGDGYELEEEYSR
jgi:hypothetical protein